MVDGVDVGKMIEITKEHLKEEFFRNADMLCIEPGETVYHQNPDSEGVNGHRIYAIYDNKVITSFLPNTFREQFWEINNDRIIQVRKKPFVLNGESNTHFNHQNL